MVQPLTILAQKLDAQQQESLTRDILEKIKSSQDEKLTGQYVTTFCQILEVNSDLKSRVFDDVTNYCKLNIQPENVAKASRSEFLDLFKLYHDEKLCSEMINDIISILAGFYKSHLFMFEKIAISVDNEEPNSSIDCSSLSVIDICHYLDFINWLFINSTEAAETFDNFSLDKFCLIFQTAEDHEVSVLSGKIIKHRIHYYCSSDQISSFMFKAVDLLMATDIASCHTIAYIIWFQILRCYGNKYLQGSTRFQDMMKMESYWYALRNGLASTVHENRKYCLVIIRISLEALVIDLSLPIMTWKVQQRDLYLKSWQKFSTLYEIMGIDVSMNQAEAAKGDVIKILSPSSLIPVQFALTILSVGFQASTDRVRNLALELTFALPESSLGLFKHDFSFLSDIFLPHAMVASHFKVVKQSDGSYKCLYGEQLANYIEKCIVALPSDEDRSVLSSKILTTLAQNRFGYGPVRAFITMGMYEGFKQISSHCLKPEELNTLYQLFEVETESGIWNKILQTLYLRLLLHLDLTQFNEGSLFGAIAQHVKFNGYEAYCENEEFFLDFINESFKLAETKLYLKENAELLDPDTLIIVSSYLLHMNVKEDEIASYIANYSQLNTFIVRAASSGLGFDKLLLNKNMVGKLGALVGKMTILSQDIDSSLYNDIGPLIHNKVLFGFNFWTKVNVSNMYSIMKKHIDSVSSASMISVIVAEFKMFTACVEECVFNEDFNLTPKLILELASNAFKLDSDSNQEKTIHKDRDQFNGQVMDLAAEIVEARSITENEKAYVLSFVSNIVDGSESYAFDGIITLLLALFESPTTITTKDYESIIDTLRFIWQEFLSEKLIMNQRKIHLKFISLILHERFLTEAHSNAKVASFLYNVCSKMIELSWSKKSILPALFKALSNYQISNPDEFEKSNWIPKILVDGTALYQSDNSVFWMDTVLADIYDDKYNISGKKVYDSINGIPEVAYHIYDKAAIASVKSGKFAEAMWEYVFSNEDKFHLIKPIKRTDHKEQWRRIEILSMMMLSIDIMDGKALEKYLIKYLEPILFEEPSPLCRSYLEWIVAFTITKYPGLKDEVLSSFTKGLGNGQPMVVSLYERIIALTILQKGTKVESSKISKFLINVVIPFATSNRALVRHFSASMICVVMDAINREKLELSSELLTIMKNITKNIPAVSKKGSYRSADALMWDIRKDLTMCGVNGGVLLKTCDRKVDAIFENQWKKYLTLDQRQILRIAIGEDQAHSWLKVERKSKVRADTYITTDEAVAPLQTKSGVWSSVMETDSDLRAVSNIKRSPLIVMASLVEKAPNLGGICRLCDCLGAGWMTVNDINVKKDHQFTSVAVTADKWMPLVQVKVDHIVEFMRKEKKDGYTLIGLEQTDDSLELNSRLQFPKKSLIVLGKEREGIPAHILAELDECIIIKQSGVVRSMNIQTATAVIVQAYSAQHC